MDNHLPSVGDSSPSSSSPLFIMSKALTNYKQPAYRPQYSRSLGAPATRPKNVFRDVIQRDSTCCNNCFSDRFSVEAADWKCGDQGWLHWERHYPIPGANEPNVPTHLRRGTPLHCANCGFDSPMQRPLSLQRATEYAVSLSRALEARDVEHDTETLLREVREAKRAPEYQGQDSKIFGEPVEEAVRAARR